MQMVTLQFSAQFADAIFGMISSSKETDPLTRLAVRKWCQRLEPEMLSIEKVKEPREK